MDAALKLWVVIIVVGLLNYLSRLSFIAFFARRSIPPLLGRALRYVPAAMLTALIVPMIAVAPVHESTGATTRVVAAVLAAGVAFVTHSTLATLGAGMVALWLLRALPY